MSYSQQLTVELMLLGVLGLLLVGALLLVETFSDDEEDDLP